MVQGLVPGGVDTHIGGLGSGTWVRGSVERYLTTRVGRESGLRTTLLRSKYPLRVHSDPVCTRWTHYSRSPTTHTLIVCVSVSHVPSPSRRSTPERKRDILVILLVVSSNVRSRVSFSGRGDHRFLPRRLGSLLVFFPSNSTMFVVLPWDTRLGPLT